MIKRSPGRNQRSKGIKVKHVLQITLLLGVCFWLIYQIKHSHDKKEFNENDAKVSGGTQTLKLGRKDLPLGKDEVNQNEKHDEEEEDEDFVEEGVRSGGDEQEEDENKTDEMEDERGGGDDEIDENDQEQSAVGTDSDEEFMDDDDKGNEEESDEKDKENIKDEEKDGSVANHNSHEAREENYKGDDASSAVSHDTSTISIETETLSLENSDVHLEMNITESENRTNYSEESNKNQHSSNFIITEAELPGEPYYNATSGKEIGSNSLSNIVDSSHLDNITTTFSDRHLEAGNNLTEVIPGGSNNLKGTSANTSSEPNKNGNIFIIKQVQNVTVITKLTGDVKNVQTEELKQGGNIVSEENLLDSDLTVSIETEKRDAAAGEFSNLEGGELEKTTRFVASIETENSGNTETSETNKTQNVSYMHENNDATKDEIKADTPTDGTSDSRVGTSNSVEHHDTDSSASHILKNAVEVRTDLDTLPDIRNEGDNGDATATD